MNDTSYQIFNALIFKICVVEATQLTAVKRPENGGLKEHSANMGATGWYLECT